MHNASNGGGGKEREGREGERRGPCPQKCEHPSLNSWLRHCINFFKAI